MQTQIDVRIRSGVEHVLNSDDVRVINNRICRETEIDRVVPGDVVDDVDITHDSSGWLQAERVITAGDPRRINAFASPVADQQVIPETIAQNVVIIVTEDHVVAIATEGILDAVVIGSAAGSCDQPRCRAAEDAGGGACVEINVDRCRPVTVIDRVVTAATVDCTRNGRSVPQVEAVVLSQRSHEELEVRERQILLARRVRSNRIGPRRPTNARRITGQTEIRFISHQHAGVGQAVHQLQSTVGSCTTCGIEVSVIETFDIATDIPVVAKIWTDQRVVLSGSDQDIDVVKAVADYRSNTWRPTGIIPLEALDAADSRQLNGPSGAV